MHKYEETPGTPIYSWCEDIEEDALNQMKEVAAQPYTKFCALMPDAHSGYTMPIGGVVACKDVVVPVFVGVDIACGMLAVKTDIPKSIFTSTLINSLHYSIEKEIPLGFSHNDDKRFNHLVKEYSMEYDTVANIYGTIGIPTITDKKGFHDEWFSSLGTLGGGNHFIEFQYDEDDIVWIMIHSGSRGLGKKVCDYYNKEAETLCKRWYSQGSIPFLPVASDAGKDYIKDMNICMQFSYLNRLVILDAIEYLLTEDYSLKPASDDQINIHHNFTALEYHMGGNYWVHRKGATMAMSERYGIIPGSMGSSSFIVEGLDSTDNTLAMKSCSHGAGRVCSRKKFNEEANKDPSEVLKSIDGVKCSEFKPVKRGRKSLDVIDYSEAPAAYKDISKVMENQSTLVKIVHTLNPILNIKG